MPSMTWLKRTRWCQRASYYLSGLDPAFQRLSPGTVMIGHAIEEAVRAGASGFDFLRGKEAYKYKWGAKDRPTYRCVLRPTQSR